jgi:hypothetical protein
MRRLNIVLFLSLSIFIAPPSHASWFGNVCDFFFPSEAIPNNALKHAMPDDMLKDGTAIERASLFQEKFPDRIKILDDVNLDLTTPQGNWVKRKKVLVISVKDMDDAARDELVKEFNKHLSHNSVMYSGGGHLYTKIGNKVYDHLSGISEKDYRISLGDFSPVVTFSDAEFFNLKGYVHFARKDYKKTIGGFEYNGTLESSGQIKNNCGIGSKHNCTSWMGLAPIGENGENIRALTGGRGWEVHTNPMWWKGFLTTRGSEERVPFIVHFTTETVEHIETTFRQSTTVAIGGAH